MRIGIDARPLSYRLTGIGCYLKSLLDELQAMSGQHQFVLISNTEIAYDLYNPRWSRKTGSCPGKLLSTVWMQSVVPVLARRLKLDLFWGPRHHLPVFLPPGVRRVVTIHDLVHRRYPETMFLPGLMSERMLMRLSLRSADRIVTVSHATREELLRLYPVRPARVRAVHSGVPEVPGPGADSPGGSWPERYFLCVGTLEPRKNVERVLRAFARIDAPGQGVHLVIAGDAGWKNGRFMRMLEAHPLRSFVHVTGYVTRETLGGLYRHALALVFPSLYEGFGFPILEAMRSGTPVITSDGSATAEVAGGAALLVDPRSVDAIARSMARILRDDVLRDDLVRRGAGRVTAFSWQEAAAEMLRIFEGVSGT